MTVRTAEEAELSDPSTRRNPIWPRTDDDNDGGNSTSTPEDNHNNALDALTYIRVPARGPLEIHGWDPTTTIGHLNADQ